MSKVGIIGYGITPFTNTANHNLESVLLHSVKNLFKSTNCDRKDIDAVLVANAAGGYKENIHHDENHAQKDDNSHNDNTKHHTNNHTTVDNNVKNKNDSEQKRTLKKGSGYMAPILAELAGIRPKTAHTVESLCSSGSNAIVSGYAYIASGLADVVLISGAEIRDSLGRILWWDDSRGKFKHPVFWASLFTSKYKRTYNVSDDDLAVIPARAFANARLNPDALASKPYSIQDVIQSRYLTGDLRVLDCSRPCTGGASILLASEDVASSYTDTPVWITGIGQKTLSAGFAKSAGDLTSIESARHASQDALHMAGRHNSLDISDVDVAEIHDAFSVCEPMILEALKVAKPGRGIEISKEMYETGNNKFNPRGGLIGSGHPLGATGIAQTIEVARQLRSESHNRQVDASETGLVHNMSAAGTSSTVLVLQR